VLNIDGDEQQREGIAQYVAQTENERVLDGLFYLRVNRGRYLLFLVVMK
jgi:hypothetical protein